ncbi:unnamed protein product [Merluccius merluccius]
MPCCPGGVDSDYLTNMLVHFKEPVDVKVTKETTESINLPSHSHRGTTKSQRRKGPQSSVKPSSGPRKLEGSSLKSQLERRADEQVAGAPVELSNEKPGCVTSLEGAELNTSLAFRVELRALQLLYTSLVSLAVEEDQVMVQAARDRLLLAPASCHHDNKERTGQGGRVVFYVSHPGFLRNFEFDPIIFPMVDVNRGSAYNPTTGVFTVPYTGIYFFLFSSQMCRGNHINTWYIMVDYSKMTTCHGQVDNDGTALITCYYMGELRKGKQVWVKQDSDSCAWATTSSRTISFSGVGLTSDGEVGPLPPIAPSSPQTPEVGGGGDTGKEGSSATASLPSFTTALLVALFSSCSSHLLS